MCVLEMKNLHVNSRSEEILRGLDLNIGNKEIHVLMGPNGSGKSTLAQTLISNPSYSITKGKINFCKENILDLDPCEISQKGIFVSFQHPSEIPGVSVSGFLRTIYNKVLEQKGDQPISPIKFRKILTEKLELLNLDELFVDRYLNDGFSGGEKKKMEILQMLLLNPKLAVLDEIDSGLDIDSLKIVLDIIKSQVSNKRMSVLIITHYTSILDHINPDAIHIIKDGKIVDSGNEEIVRKLESSGYSFFEDGFK